MTTVICSWIVILGCLLIFGKAFVSFYGKNASKCLKTSDVYIVCGLMVVNVYAEIFSVFYKVSFAACILLLFLGVGIIIYIFSNKVLRLDLIQELSHGYQEWIRFIPILLAITFVTLVWTSGSPAHYDTGLYHAQAIEWIEKYSVVKGLGNLHNRFAYNSAFMVVQALFSFEWGIGQSLHSLNGFLCTFFLVFAIKNNSILYQRKITASACLKIVSVIYIVSNRNLISSPNSDILALLLVVYIAIKWCEFVEEGIDSYIPYALLAIISVYAVTVKLSAATCVLLVICPAYLLIKNKAWGAMIKNVICGIIVALPFIWRNILISGYLIYPYYKIDIFSVDWKMPSSILEFDQKEISVWGRGIKDVGKYGYSISSWFPDWFSNIGRGNQLLFLCSIITLIFLIIHFIKKRRFESIILTISIVSGALLWLNTAPLIRYGQVYLLLIPFLWIGLAFENKKLISSMHVSILVIGLIYVAPYLASAYNWREAPLVQQGDYNEHAVSWVMLDENYSVAIPSEGDQVGYNTFPSTPYQERLKSIELRGNDLKDGFRTKGEYFEQHLNTYGYIW